ncbi:MAG: hypothetical protein Q7S77_02210 [Candidatus Staskawiczbacteria bacterium]|nr:hypothetical protein [Candidatus Staskawiczbacteria bacterium]
MSCPHNFSKVCTKDTLAWILLILGLLIMPLAVISLWLRITLLDSDQFAKTLSPLSTNPVIVSAVAKNLAGNFFQHVDIEGKLQESLPEGSRFLAPAFSSNLQSFVENQGQNIVTSKEFNSVWVTIIKTIHPQMMNILQGKGNLIKTQNGMVVLDFKDAVLALNKQLNQRGITVFNNININTKVVLLQSEKLAKLQQIVGLILRLGAILPILALVLIISAVLSSSEHRKFLVYVGFGLSISMILLLYLINVGHQQFIEASGELSTEVVSTFYKIITHYLKQSALIVLILGIIISLGANYLPKKFHIQ